VREGRAIGEVAKSGGFEASHVSVLLGDSIAAGVVEIAAGIGADAEIVKLVIGEGLGLADGVADGAVGLLGIGEEFEASLRSGRESLLVVGEVEAIEGRIAGDDRAFERGDRLGDQVDGDLVGSPGFLKEFAVLGIGLKTSDYAVEGMRHFDRIRDGAFGLFIERGRAAVPKLK